MFFFWRRKNENWFWVEAFGQDTFVCFSTVLNFQCGGYISYEKNVHFIYSKGYVYVGT